MIDMDNIKVVKEKRKSLAVEVYPNFTVLVKSPEQAKDFEIKDFIKRKTTWIEKQLNYFKQFNMPEDKVYESGSSALYLGRQYQVIIEKSPLLNIIKFLNNKIYILTPSPQKLDEINHALQNWFIRRGETIFNERLNFCMKAFPDLKMPKLKIRKLTPKECWRLMSFTDSDIEKCISIGISNTQLYKQAGNSIVVKVLEGIFRNLLC